MILKKKTRLSPLLPIDELSILPVYDWEYTDGVIRKMDLKFMRRFGYTKLRLMHLTEREILKLANEMYDDMLLEVYGYYMEIAQHQYRKAGGSGNVTWKWLRDHVTRNYDPVTKRVFHKEADRKRSIYIESVLASDNRAAENDVRMRDWIRFVNQGAMNCTDQAVIQALKDQGISRVRWVTRRDEKVCNECCPRHNVIYDIDKVPDKHPNCRCELLPVRS